MKLFIAKSLLALTLLLPLSRNANAAIDDWWEKCKNAQADCEFSAFKDIAPIYRPSKEENLFADYIKSVFNRSKTEIWENDPRVTLAQDSTGSLFIQIPATGKFKNRHEPSFAIQAHIDMVLAKKGAKPGEDLRPYFKGELEFEEVQGWFQSKNNERSIGADNSTGVALALRYLIDRNRAHPNLEIIFTVQEETGMAGALNFNFPLKSTRLISLDNMSSSFVTVGCQGASMNLVQGEIKTVPADRAASYYRVSVSDLVGGHSGSMIHRPRANAIKIIAGALKQLALTNPDFSLNQFTSGNMKVFNVIPNAAEAVFSTRLPVDPAAVETSIRNELAKFSDENPGLFHVSVVRTDSANSSVLNNLDSVVVLDRATAIPHGVTTSDPDFLNGVKTSTNFSTIQWAPGSEPVALITFGFMTRSFDSGELKAVVDQSISTVLHDWPSLEKGAFTNFASIDAWSAPKDSPLLKLALSDPQFTGTYLVPAYVEATVFSKKYPQMDIIGIGPDVLDYHTNKERVRIGSMSEISAAVARILAN